jgi:hypothetical protein
VRSKPNDGIHGCQNSKEARATPKNEGTTPASPPCPVRSRVLLSAYRPNLTGVEPHCASIESSRSCARSGHLARWYLRGERGPVRHTRRTDTQPLILSRESAGRCRYRGSGHSACRLSPSACGVTLLSRRRPTAVRFSGFAPPAIMMAQRPGKFAAQRPLQRSLGGSLPREEVTI